MSVTRPAAAPWRLGLALAGLVLALHGLLVAGGLVPLFEDGALTHLSDPDSYARLLRIERLHETGTWHSPVVPLLNAPDGLEWHWTLPGDALVRVGAELLAPLTGFRAGLMLWGAAMGPLLHLLAIPLLLGLALPLRVRVIAILLLAQPAVTFNFVAGTADHHGLMALAALGVFGWAATGRMAAAGLAAALATWISPEGVLLAVPVLAALGWGWIAEGDEGGARRFCAGFAGGLMAALALERPPAEWGAVDLYRLSLPHLSLALAANAVVWGATALGLGRARRALMLAVLAGAAGMGLALAFPGLFADPQAKADPIMRRLLLDAVGVEYPLSFATMAHWRDAALGLGPVLPALAFSVWALARRPAQERGRHRLALAAVLLLTLYVLLGKARGLHYVAVAVVLPWAEMVAALPRRWGLAAALGHWLAFAGLGVAAGGAGLERPDCPIAAAARVIPRASTPPGTILADLFAGPEIAWRTGWGVLGAPYDQDVAGMRDGALLLDAVATGPDFWDLMRRRRVGAVLLCREAPPDSPADGLAARLLDGRPPPGFVRVPVPGEAGRKLVLYRVTS